MAFGIYPGIAGMAPQAQQMAGSVPQGQYRNKSRRGAIPPMGVQALQAQQAGAQRNALAQFGVSGQAGAPAGIGAGFRPMPMQQQAPVQPGGWGGIGGGLAQQMGFQQAAPPTWGGTPGLAGRMGFQGLDPLEEWRRRQQLRASLAGLLSFPPMGFGGAGF